MKTFWKIAAGALLMALAGPAQTPLKTINNPGGGSIVYGPMDGQTSEPGAMGTILRSLHNQYGDRPQVGKPFHVRGGNSVAVYFTLVKKTQGNKPVAGLLIANKVADNRVEAALVSDDAGRFRTTINPMLKTLFGAWHPGGATTPTASAAPGGPAAALHAVVTPDRSAGASLPQGWEALPGNGGGTLFAKGPNGEAAFLGFAMLAMNSRDPRVQQTMRFAQSPAGRQTSYATALYYPYGGDLAKTFLDLLNMSRGKKGLGPGTIDFTTKERVPSAGANCVYLSGRANFPDAKGPAEINTVFCLGVLAPMGSYLAFVNQMAVPVALADKERATMQAVLQSFWVNQAKVDAQAAAIAKPAIDAIHEIGRRAAQQAAESHAAFDAHNRSVEKQWDANDRRSQEFSNYQLDQTVIQDNELNAHGTVWNQAADALVKADPKRYEYVDRPNFWKGVDY